MRKLILLCSLCSLLPSLGSAQDLASIPWSTYLLRDPGSELVPFPSGTLVDVEITVKDNGTVWYIENHNQVMLNDISQLNIVIGQGMLSPESPLPELRNKFIAGLEHPEICYKLKVHDQGEDLMAEGSHLYYAPPLARHAIQANTADGLGPYIFSQEERTFLEWLYDDSLDKVLLAFGQNELIRVLNDIIEVAQEVNAVNGDEVDVLHNKIYDNADAVATGGIPSPVESQYTHCCGTLVNFYNGYEFKRPFSNSPPLDHATAAVYAENIYDGLGVGLFANGASRGSYSQGQTGMLGLTVGSGNGAAAWGRVNQAPAAGGFKYGLLGENQGLSESWAAAIFGDGFYTGTWSQASDARLKTEIHSTENGLNTILKLRPAQYQYITDTPYNLPTGVHHGFIAQEVEEVLPELVSDIVMPTSLDPDKIQGSGTATYKAVNYVELIPILTAALQELSQTVEAQGKEIERLNQIITAEATRK